MAKKRTSESEEIVFKNIKMFGGSLGVVLPKAITQFGFHTNQKVVIVIKSREITILPQSDIEIVKKQND